MHYLITVRESECSEETYPESCKYFEFQYSCSSLQLKMLLWFGGGKGFGGVKGSESEVSNYRNPGTHKQPAFSPSITFFSCSICYFRSCEWKHEICILSPCQFCFVVLFFMWFSWRFGNMNTDFTTGCYFISDLAVVYFCSVNLNQNQLLVIRIHCCSCQDVLVPRSPDYT